MKKSDSPALQLRDITKTFPVAGSRKTVLSEVSIEVGRSELVWLSGSSGSGKSSLVRVAGLLSTPDKGSVRIQDSTARTARECDRLRAQAIGIVFQDANLLPELTLEQNLAITSLSGGRRQRRGLVKSFGLGEVLKSPARLLSGGEAQRAALCRALVNNPVVLLADEPTSALDEANAQTVLAALRACADRGAGVLVASHDPRVGSIADRTLTMQEGHCG